MPDTTTTSAQILAWFADGLITETERAAWLAELTEHQPNHRSQKIMSRTFTQRLSHIFYVHHSATGACFLLLAALVEILCGYNVDEMTATWIAYPAAGLFAIVALCNVWSIIRFERKYA